MTTIITFGSSLGIILILLLVKIIELKFDKKNIILGLIGKFDHIALGFIQEFKFRSLQIIQTTRYLLLVQSRELSRNLFYKTQEKILLEYRAREEALMGRKNILNKGSVSFYLKKITEEKSGLDKGRIEEELV